MSSSLDIEQSPQLEDYLRRTGRVASSETLTMRTLGGGVSCRTVLVEFSNGPAWVVKQALAKLRVAVDWFTDPARMEREALAMIWLGRLAPVGSITRLIFQDPEHHLLAMEAVPQPHDNLKSLLLAGRVETSHVEQFGRLLGIIHRRAWENRDQLAGPFADQCFFQTLRLEAYYQYTATQVPEVSPFITRLVADTKACRLTLVHGDYSPKNVLVHRDHLVLLDHEVMHWGDPTFDLGFSLTHFLSKAHHMPQYRARFASAVNEYWNAYTSALASVPWGGEVEARAVRQTLGCLLARVAGRSPLEYLGPEERLRQRNAVVALMADPPQHIDTLTREFLNRVH